MSNYIIEDIQQKRNILVEYFCAFPNTPKHKPSSKTYRRAIYYINKMKNGEFFQYQEFDPNWLDRCKIDNYMLFKRWESSEIKENFFRLSRLFVDTYWPPNKKHVPRKLDQLILNVFAGKSWFLFVHVNPPRRIPIYNIEKSFERLDNQEKYVYNMFNETLNKLTVDIDNTQSQNILKTIFQLKSWYNNNENKLRKQGIRNFRSAAKQYERVFRSTYQNWNKVSSRDLNSNRVWNQFKKIIK